MGLRYNKKSTAGIGCAAVDGYVSNQSAAYKSENPGLLSQTFLWESPCTGYSPLIKAIQKKVGATQDGRIGPNTIKAMQRWLAALQLMVMFQNIANTRSSVPVLAE